jgi:cell division protease FtsH
MTWDIDTKIQITKKRLMDPVLFEGKMYSKLLIVISGNIDEAYRMAKNVDDVDFDADIFHEYSKKITILDIKNALTQRFKPEQIARFGNIHIIYPSLSKQNYRDIIKKKSLLIVQKAIEKHGIDIEIDQSVYETIYLNGVFPTQGVRPVLSTISSIIENSLPKFLLKAMELNEKKIKIRTENDEIVATIGPHELRSKIYTMIENLRKVNSSDKLALTAVHEAGHALVYAIRFGYVPIQLTCDTASTTMGGFMYPSSLSENKERIIWEIECDMAGFAAEEIMFGDSQTSTGHASDMMTATARAASFVRKYGFDNFTGRFFNEIADKGCEFLQNVSDTDKSIEKILIASKTSAREIINKNIHFYKSIVSDLFKKKSLSAEEIIQLGKVHNVTLEYYSKAEILYPKYEEMLIKRLKE